MDTVTENVCDSTIHCYLTLIDLGIRAGGGIGDQLPHVSYPESTYYYVGRFFYNITFHIFVILILSNIFFGIIVDAFGDLRDEQFQIDNDILNVCFICQITRDSSINKNIDFKKHIYDDHRMWNYVYFLTYLHMENPNNFSALENYVWDKLERKDIQWIPIVKNDEEK